MNDVEWLYYACVGLSDLTWSNDGTEPTYTRCHESFRMNKQSHEWQQHMGAVAGWHDVNWDVPLTVHNITSVRVGMGSVCKGPRRATCPERVCRDDRERPAPAEDAQRPDERSQSCSRRLEGLEVASRSKPHRLTLDHLAAELDRLQILVQHAASLLEIPDRMVDQGQLAQWLRAAVSKGAGSDAEFASMLSEAHRPFLTQIIRHKG